MAAAPRIYFLPPQLPNRQVAARSADMINHKPRFLADVAADEHYYRAYLLLIVFIDVVAPLLLHLSWFC